VRQEPIKTRKWKWDSVNQVGLACCIHCNKQAVPNRHASFGHASKLYSPFITVPELAEKWILAKDDPESKQTFMNTQLGLPFEAQALRKIEPHILSKRREEYPAEVPAGVVRITAGIDVQPGSAENEGRLEVEIVGWGRGEESWSIFHDIIKGDPVKPEIWNELDQLLLRGFDYERGGRMIISAACIDSGGYNTQEVYQYARPRIARNIWAIKGASDKGGQWSPVWPVPKKEVGKWRRAGYKPVILGVNAAKESIRQKLLVEEPGPGYCHFNREWSDSRFEQLTAEQLVLENKSGFKTRKWVLQKGRANEALDTRVYAYAALCGLYAVRKLNLESAATVLETMQIGRAIIGANEVGAVEPKQAPVPTVRRSSFMS
jgi:phage terminase large subunit GpA-like protein